MFAEIMNKWAMAPFDMTTWTLAVLNRKPPEWVTPNKVVYTTPFGLLRDFTVGDDDVVPTLIFPPMAGHSSHVVDFKDQSQIQLVINHGLTRAYAFDWLSATQATRNVTIEDRMEFITDSVSYILAATGKDKVNVIGNCQGGWEASIWAAMHNELVNTLIVAGSPIDTSVEQMQQLKPLIKTLQLAGPDWTDAFLRLTLAAEGGVHRGLSQLSLFVGMHPTSHPASHIKLYGNIREPGAIEKFTKFYDWYFYPVDMSGALFRWVLPHLFVNNELYRGKLEVGGQLVDLGNIHCPVFLLAGEGDDITPKDQQLNMAKVVAEDADVYQAVCPGGHIGLFIGSRSQREYWPVMLAKVRLAS